jgi:molybdopterin-biosynthesis enzyme MoeA-like protein
MATTPEGASLIYSLQTKAPGFRVENVCVLAGIPSIFNEMVDAVLSTMPEMAKIYTLSIEGEAHEGGIAKELELVQKAYLGKVFIGSYPKMTESGKSSLQITFRSRDLDLANECKEKVKKFIPLS